MTRSDNNTGSNDNGIDLSQESTLRPEERVARVTDQLPVMFYTCRNDKTYSIIYISEQSFEITGYSSEELIAGKVILGELIHPDDVNYVVREVNAAVQERRPFLVTYRLSHRNGDWRWVEGNGVGIYTGDELQLVQGFIVDITQKRREVQEREVLSKLSLDMTSVETMDKLANVVVAAISARFEWGAFYFSVRQSGTTRIKVISEADTYDGLRKFAYNRITVVSEASRRNEPALELRSPGISVDPDVPFGDKARMSQSLMFVPLRIINKHIGVLSVQSYSSYAYNEADMAFLQKLADNVAPTVERVRGEERNRAFAKLGEELNAATTPEEAALVLLDFADELIGWDACGIEQYSVSENLIYDVVGFDIIEGSRTKISVRQFPLAPTGYNQQALNEGYVLITREPASDQKPGKNSFGDASRASASILFVAMRSSSGVSGFIGLHSYTFNAYDMEDVKVLQMLANFASSALERTWNQQNFRLREERYRSAITAAGAVPYQLDHVTDSYTFVGEGIEKITGWSSEEFNTERWREMVQEVVVPGATEGASLEDIAREIKEEKRTNWRADVRIKTRSGTERWISDTAVESPARNGKLVASLGILQDISERKEYEKSLLFNSMHDSLTGLANRALLLDHLHLAICRAQRRDKYRFAVLFLDVDRFKQVNDSLGHMAGDALLSTIAGRLQKSLRPGDTAARFAGDEFVVLLDDIHRLEDVLPVAERILDELRQPVTLNGKEIFTSASMGIAISASSYHHAEDLLRDADNALYRAKKRGKGRYEIFDKGMYDQAVKALELESDFRRALTANQFLLHYQPIIDLNSGRVVKFEALVRWNHPGRGLVSPGEFIPMAEETGMISLLGLWVIDEASAQLRRWHKEFPQHPLLVMSVNLSVRQFADENLADRIYDIVQSRNISPNNLVLEITETVFLEKMDTALKLLNRLKTMGFGLALDDFGTGYSSLSNLHGFPVDWIKIDRSFTSRLGLPGPETEIVRAIVNLGNRLGIGVTAEGVETEGQVAILRDVKCRHVQGFLFSRPLPVVEATAFIKSNQRNTGLPGSSTEE